MTSIPKIIHKTKNILTGTFTGQDVFLKSSLLSGRNRAQLPEFSEQIAGKQSHGCPQQDARQHVGGVVDKKEQA